MRKLIREKLDYYYQEMFDELTDYILSLDSIEFYVTMSSKIMDNEGRTSNVHLMGYNAMLLLPEIFDDFSCAIELFHDGYFKQSKQVLRNTLELAIQFAYIDILIQDNRIADNSWVKKEKGVSKMVDMIKELQNESTYNIMLLREFKKMYNLLNSVTHSHKRHLNTLAAPRNEFCGIRRVDHTEVANTRIITLLCIQNVLNLIATYYKGKSADDGVDKIIKELETVISKIGKHSTDLENYKKGDYENGAGILIFRKNMILMNNKSMLYSYKANREVELPSKINIYQSDYKFSFRKIEEQLYRANKLKHES